MSNLISHQDVRVNGSPVAHALFENRRFAWLLIIPRVYLGWLWVDASQHKIIDPKWVETGEALKGFWFSAIKVDPKPVAFFDWYRQFLQFLLDTQSYVWFGKLVAYGELLIGIALILGAFTGIAAFLGGFMNWNYMMAGTASSNPVLFVLAVLMIMAWKTAGYWGLDRWLLPLLGTPWKPAIHVGTPSTQPASG